MASFMLKKGTKTVFVPIGWLPHPVKDMFFSAMQLANMGYEHKIFRQMLKLICSLLLNKTLKQAFSYTSLLKN